MGLPLASASSLRSSIAADLQFLRVPEVLASPFLANLTLPPGVVNALNV